METSECINPIESAHNDSITCVKFAPTTELFITASLDGTSKTWENTGKSKDTYVNNEPISTFAVAIDGSLVCTGQPVSIDNIMCTNRLEWSFKSMGT